MLEGLEITEISINDLERTQRLDSEYYSKENINVTNILQMKPYKFLTDFVSVSDGNHMSISEKFSNVGIPYYRGQDVHTFFIEQSSPICIDEKTFDEPVMVRSHLKKGDVLLTIVGTIGNLSLVYSDKKQTCSCKLAILRPSVFSEFVATFLASKYGQSQIKMYTRGAVQMGLILEDMNQIIVPVFSIQFQKLIVQLVQDSYSKIVNSKSLYSQAEDTLFQNLDLHNWKPTEQSTTIKSLSTSFAVSGRLDAEYYQPKYDDLETILLNCKEGAKRLGSCIEYLYTGEFSDSVSTYEPNLVPYIINTHIKKLEINPTENSFVKNDSHQRFIKEGEILTGRVGAVGNFGIVDKGNIGSVCSDNIIAFKLKKELDPVVYGLYFNSAVCKMQIERITGGSVQPLITQTNLQNILIPILPIEIQKELSKQIKQSFKLRQQSDKLIDIAKQAVEMAIEQNEEAALQYIKANTA